MHIISCFFLVFTWVSAVKDAFSLWIELVSQYGAIVHVTGVNEALCSIFKEQVTLSILLRLKQVEPSIWTSSYGFL